MAGRRSSRARLSGQRGFTYLWLLAAIAMLSVGLLAVSEVWVSSAQRQKFVELDWIGDQFTRAIGSYYQATPGAVKAYPASLNELVDDRRYVTGRRHLRTVYANPFTGSQDWVPIVAADGKIRGVRVVVHTDRGITVREYVYVPSASNP